MAVNLSIKNVPEKLADAIRKRAARNHRSLQGELVAILQQVAAESSLPQRVSVARERPPITSFGRPTHWTVAPRSEGTLMIREARDGRTFTVRDLLDYVSSLGQGTPDESTAWIRQMRSSR